MVEYPAMRCLFRSGLPLFDQTFDFRQRHFPLRHRFDGMVGQPDRPSYGHAGYRMFRSSPVSTPDLDNSTAISPFQFVGQSLGRFLGHTKLESTVRYLGMEVDDALEIAERMEV